MFRKVACLALGSVMMSLTWSCASEQPHREPPVSAEPAPIVAQPEPSQPSPQEAPRADLSAAISKFAPGWMVRDCGDAMSPGIRDVLGKKNVLVTHPVSATTPCVIGQRVDVLPDKQTRLRLVVGHHPEGSWLLRVTANRELLHQVIGKETAPDGWTNVVVDLSEYAGQFVTLQLINAVHGEPHPEAYWAQIEIESTD